MQNLTFKAVVLNLHFRTDLHKLFLGVDRKLQQFASQDNNRALKHISYFVASRHSHVPYQPRSLRPFMMLAMQIS